MMLLSIYPKHVESILKGIKRYEFRKISLKKNALKEELIIVYETRPINSIRIILKVGKVIEDNIYDLWARFGAKSGIPKGYFFSYYKADRKINLGRGVAIEIKKFIRLNKSISLEDIRKDYPNFSPPQNHYIISKEKYPLIYKKIKSQISNKMN